MSCFLIHTPGASCPGCGEIETGSGDTWRCMGTDPDGAACESRIPVRHVSDMDKAGDTMHRGDYCGDHAPAEAAR